MFSTSIADGLELTPWLLAAGTAANSPGSLSQTGTVQGQPTTECAFFAISPTGPNANAYWYKQLGLEPSRTKFRYAASFLFPTQADADACQALELDLQQSIAGVHLFNAAWQFDFAGGSIRVWDRAAKMRGDELNAWSTAIAGLKRWNPDQWFRIEARAERSANQVFYNDIRINSVKTALSISKDMPTIDLPQMMNLGIQLDGNANKDSYRVMVDAVSLQQSD